MFVASFCATAWVRQRDDSVWNQYQWICNRALQLIDKGPSFKMALPIFSTDEKNGGPLLIVAVLWDCLSNNISEWLSMGGGASLKKSCAFRSGRKKKTLWNKNTLSLNQLTNQWLNCLSEKLPIDTTTIPGGKTSYLLDVKEKPLIGDFTCYIVWKQTKNLKL